MFRYFNNLSAFRVLFWCLLAVSAGIYFSLPPEPPPDDAATLRQKTVDSLLEGADSFSHFLSAQESLAVSLAIRFEALGHDQRDEGNLNKLLARALDSSPNYVVGLGFALPGQDGSANRLAFRSKSPKIPTGNSHPGSEVGDYPGSPSAREINLERRVKWTMQFSPQDEDPPEFYAILYVSVKCPEDPNPCGDVVVASDLGGLRTVLAKMRRAGATNPLCVSPDKDVVWLDDNGVLRHDGDARHRPGDAVARAKAIVRNAENTEEFLQADVISSGWKLMLDNPAWHPGRRRVSTSLPLFGLLVAAAALLLEGALSAVRGKTLGAGTSVRRLRKRDTAGGRRRFEKIRRFLFQYRISNPDQARIESELRVAREIQFTLVPIAFPAYSQWREFDLHAVLHPAKEVAGDYYDFFMPTTDRLVVTVGDVSGKGFPAALYMAVCRTAFRALASQAAGPGQLLSRLNDMLVRDNNSGLYVTIVCLFVDLSTGKCEYSIAGHPAPLLYRADSNDVECIDAPRETIIGMKAGVDYPTGELRLGRGDTILLYSDGVSEARNGDGDELEYDGLREHFLKAVGTPRCRTLIEKLDISIGDFVGDGDQTDDVTMLALRYWGPGGQMMAAGHEASSRQGKRSETTSVVSSQPKK